jgi:hypothetical protein
MPTWSKPPAAAELGLEIASPNLDNRNYQKKELDKHDGK